jgi:hypothetical protein
MTQSLTDWLQQSRVIVVGVDSATHRIRVKNESEACTDVSCHERTLVRIEEKAGRPERIVVVRRAWDELTSPEW